MADDERREGATGGGPAAGRQSFIVGLRVLLLIAAAGAVVVAVTIAARGRGGDTAVRYACPMHPDVRGASPGECPICRMALERIGFVPGAVKPYLEAAGTVDLRAIDNVKKHNVVDFVKRRALLPVLRGLRAPAWVDRDGTIAAIFYADQIEAMAPDEPASFRPGDGGTRAFAARRTADAPVAWDRSTALVRFRAAQPLAPPPADGVVVGWLEVAPRPRQVLGVAASAVLQSPEGPYVLAWSGHDYTFVKRPIEIGETFLKQGFAVVLSGVRNQERVARKAEKAVEHARDGRCATQLVLV